MKKRPLDVEGRLVKKWYISGVYIAPLSEALYNGSFFKNCKNWYQPCKAPTSSFYFFLLAYTRIWISLSLSLSLSLSPSLSLSLADIHTPRQSFRME